MNAGLRRRPGVAQGRRRHGQNDLLMQFQADLLGVPVIRPKVRRDHRARRRLRGGPGDRVLGRVRGPARELGRGQALGARRWTPPSATSTTSYWKKAVTRVVRLGRDEADARTVAAARARHGRTRVAWPRPTEVLVIGGGATGAGVAWDAALRGFDVDPGRARRPRPRAPPAASTACCTRAAATSSRTRARRPSASRRTRSCARDRRRRRSRTPAACSSRRPADDPAYGDQFLAGCRRRPASRSQEIPRRRGAARASRGSTRGITPRVRGAGRVDRRLEAALGRSPRGAASTARRSCPTTGSPSCIARRRPRRRRARARRPQRARSVDIEAALHDQRRRRVGRPDRRHGRVSRASRVVPGKGIMIAMNHRLVNTVVNRCDACPPTATSSSRSGPSASSAPPTSAPRDPDDLPGHAGRGRRRCSTPASVLVPGFRQARALRVWAGVRPLFQDEQGRRGRADTRDISRGIALRRPPRARRRRRASSRSPGGKLTTYRLMAAGHRRRDVRAARRSSAAVPHGRGAARLGGRRALLRSARACAAREEDAGTTSSSICECELIARGAARGGRCAGRGTTNLDDVRRDAAAWHGPVPGRVLHLPRHRHPPRRSATLDGASAPTRCCCTFLRSAGRACEPILYGDQLRQARLDDWIFQGLLDVEHLPASEPCARDERGSSSSAPALAGPRRRASGCAEARRAA